MSDLNKNDIVFYARTIPSAGIYDVLELKIRTVEIDWFVGIEKRDKQAFLFSDANINNVIFTDRSKALEVVKAAEANKREIVYEIFYEED